MNFRDLMNSYYISEYESNEYRYWQLVERMKRRHIVPVLGSGLSSWAGYLSWSEFLLELASQTDVKDQAKTLLDKGQYTDCASLLESEMGYEKIFSACRNFYTPERIDEDKRPEYQRLIPMLFRRRILTTGIDCCIERLYKDAFVFAPIYGEKILDEIMKARLCRREERPLLVKLRGTVENEKEILLTNEQFDRFYGWGSEWIDFVHPFARETRLYLRNGIPLFLGCDLNNDRFFKALKASIGPGGFALLEKPEDESTYPVNGSMDIICGMELQVIWYPHGKHECIGILLEQLAKDMGLIPDETITIQEEKQMANQNRQRVFIVHGHDNEAKQEMARALENGGFEAVILHEQADAGLTIMEKIERYTDVQYAVVLYTECDMGRSKEDPVECERNRARQNVVFEHGYLIGKLGRDHVSALVKGNVETPGDISGVVYTKMDENGAWKIALARNMKAVGLNVDMNVFCR